MEEALDKSLEATLIESVKQGDQRAFNRLVTHYYNRVFRTAFGVTRNEENAREVTQQTWIKVWNKIKTFKGESAFSTWLYRITTFTALDFLRANKKHQRLDSIEASQENEGIKSIQLTSDHADDQPRTALRKKEIMEGFQRALEDLGEAHRTALVLREIEGLSYEEIADIMQCKIGTVMSRIFNARRAIQTQMEDFR
ncbi:MAG: sigma-70 family RNA polymerase sigma factor [Puniceicoccaceae bacterium]